VPPAHQLPERLVAVLAVIYALFNEGYGASTGADLIRTGLCAEAIHLGRLLAELMPDEPEALGLLSLMVLHDARRPARVDGAGDLVTLEDQDRSLWDTAAITEGCSVLDAAVRLRRPGPYQLQAAIAACHASASTAVTDWAEITVLYERLSQIAPSPVIALDRAVAVATADGPPAGLALVDQLEHSGALSDYHLLAATRADLLRRLGRTEQAEVAYRRALELAPTDAERPYLTQTADRSPIEAPGIPCRRGDLPFVLQVTCGYLTGLTGAAAPVEPAGRSSGSASLPLVLRCYPVPASSAGTGGAVNRAASGLPQRAPQISRAPARGGNTGARGRAVRGAGFRRGAASGIRPRRARPAAPTPPTKRCPAAAVTDDPARSVGIPCQAVRPRRRTTSRTLWRACVDGGPLSSVMPYRAPSDVR
jgi:hypothetical protein